MQETKQENRHDARTDPMLAKVRKLLAKAADPATTTAESEAYTAKAAALAAQYGIDQALLATADPAGDPVGDRVIGLDAPYAADKGQLLGAIALELRCRAVRRHRHTTTGMPVELHLFGHASDLQRAELLFTSLLLQATRDLVRTPVPDGEHVAAFRRSWLAGFTAAIATRLAEAERIATAAAERRFTAAGTSTSLVLADRTALVQQAMADAYPHLRAARPRRLSGSGDRDGWFAGQRADLGDRATVAQRERRSILPG